MNGADTLSRRNEISYPLVSIVEPVTCDDVNFSGLVVPFRLLRAAARVLSDRTDLAHAPALAGLLHNRADDMERNITLWRHVHQDIPALVESHYGTYLTVAKTVLLHHCNGRGRCQLKWWSDHIPPVA
jgi:hypothetical protein